MVDRGKRRREKRERKGGGIGEEMKDHTWKMFCAHNTHPSLIQDERSRRPLASRLLALGTIKKRGGGRGRGGSEKEQPESAVKCGPFSCYDDRISSLFHF